MTPDPTPSDLARLRDWRDLANRLRGKYAKGPILPNGEPEFGYRLFTTMPDGSAFPAIHFEAADAIDALLTARQEAEAQLAAAREALEEAARVAAGPDYPALRAAIERTRAALAPHAEKEEADHG